MALSIPDPFSGPSGPSFVGLDAGTQGLMAGGASMASQPASYFANQANQGVSEGAIGVMQGDQALAQQNAAQGAAPGSLGFQTALRNQYNAVAGQNVNRVMQSNQMNAQMQKAQMMQQYTRAYLGQQRAITQNYENLTQAYNANEQARAQFVGQLFGTMNYGIGSRMAGGQDSFVTGMNKNLDAGSISSPGSSDMYNPGLS